MFSVHYVCCAFPETDYVKESDEWASDKGDSEGAGEKSEDDERDGGRVKMRRVKREKVIRRRVKERMGRATRKRMKMKT